MIVMLSSFFFQAGMTFDVVMHKFSSFIIFHFLTPKKNWAKNGELYDELSLDLIRYGS